VNHNGTKPQSSETTYYSLLGLHPSASVIDIRRAYRELSKRYHPDTTELPANLATTKFQQINEAYATLSNPERRFSYDLKIGYSRFGVIQAPADLDRPVRYSYDYSKSAYLDASDRPLSSGEIFALFILGLTFVGCLLLAIAIGFARGEAAFSTKLTQPTPKVEKQISYLPQLSSSEEIKSFNF
jgi:curved DNA-binding protein CbpA